MRRHWASLVIGFGAAVVGVLLTLAASHLWQDHTTLHGLLMIELQRQQAAGHK